MNTRQKIAAAGLASTIAMATALSPVLAASTNNAASTPPAAAAKAPDSGTTQDTAQASDQRILQTSQDVGKGLAEARAARVAIFEGQTDMATKLANDAQTAFKAAKDNADRYTMSSAKADQNGHEYVPFDVQIALSETFKPDQSNIADLKTARDHIQKGNQKAAAETLQKANIDVMVSAAMVPVDTALQHLGDAVKFIGEKKFYEANLALKAVEDAVKVETYSPDAVPSQGKTG